MKYFLISLGVIGGFIGLGVIGSALNLINIPWLKFDSKVNLNREIIKKTYDADNALYNYHWFQERAGAIVALKTIITQSQEAFVSFETSAGIRKDWTFEDKTEDARLRAVLQGQKAQLESLVHEYNAKANEVDRSIFQNDLPLFFGLN